MNGGLEMNDRSGCPGFLEKGCKNRQKITILIGRGMIRGGFRMYSKCIKLL